jgi:hypothetical protein
MIVADIAENEECLHGNMQNSIPFPATDDSQARDKEDVGTSTHTHIVEVTHTVHFITSLLPSMIVSPPTAHTVGTRGGH